MGSIKDELLLKAQRDVSKLVKVQRMVTRGGKTFSQNFYVQPSQVKATDKVIGNQQNLLPQPGSVPKPQAGVLDKAYFDTLVSDKPKALDYLKSCGVTWKEHTHAGINWMRAMQALKGALGGQNGQQSSSQANSQPTQSKTQAAQNNQSGGQSTKAAGQTIKITIDQATQNELDACKNGREKVVVLKKKLGQAGCIQYAESIGVTWDKHDHAAINNMRMSMALQQHFDTIDGTVSPKGGGAPKGNKNAQKDNKTSKNNPDEIKIPANATQRQKNIINLINNISDKSELESYASIGMIPEDDVSKAFILDKLVPKYTVFAAANLKTSTSNSKSRYNYNSSSGFADQISFDLNYEGCAKKVVGRGLSMLYDNFNMAMLTDPRSEIATSVGNYASRKMKSDSIFGLVTRLNSNFAFYTTDDYAKADSNGVMEGRYLTSQGYTGYDPEVYVKRYDVEKEGFVRALRNIEEKYPKLESKCDEMIESYNEIMELCGGNPRLLEAVLYQHSWTDSSANGEPLIWDFGRSNSFRTNNLKPQDARETIRCLDLQYEALMKLFEEKGLSENDIGYTLGKSWYNDDLKDFRLYKENGDLIEIVNLIDTAVDSSGNLMLDDKNARKCSSGYLTYFLAKYKDEKGIEKNLSELEAQDHYKYLQQVSQFSSQDYLKVQDKIHKMFGIEFVTTDLNTGKSKTLDLTQLNPESFGVDCSDYSSVPVFDKEKDYVFSNLLMFNLENKVHSEILYHITDNPSSKLNGRGTDYSGNYSYYEPRKHLQDRNTRQKQVGTWGSTDASTTYTQSELERKINDQLDNMVTYSPDYIDHLSEYYNAKSGFQDATGEARKATFNSVGIHTDDYIDNPLKDILYNYTTAIAQNIPKMNERGKDKLDALMAKRLDYVPYDFNASKQKRLSETSNTSSQSTDKSELKKLREELFKATNCTISVEPDDVSLQMRKEFLRNWDYRDNHTEKTPDGFTKTGRMYSGPNSWQGKDRRALFNSRFFRVNNSNMEDDFDAYQTELKSDTSLDAKATEQLELYHACSYAGAAGILGKTGGWFMGNQYTKVAKALGCGGYFGFKGGKTSVYCGEGSGGYHNLSSSGAVGDNANGCYILATIMRGKTGDSQSDEGRFRDYEIAVKTNKCIKPHHFVDVSSRSLDINVKRDSQGNYVDINTGQITHDRYGQSVNMR